MCGLERSERNRLPGVEEQPVPLASRKTLSARAISEGDSPFRRVSFGTLIAETKHPSAGGGPYRAPDG